MRRLVVALALLPALGCGTLEHVDAKAPESMPPFHIDTEASELDMFAEDTPAGDAEQTRTALAKALDEWAASQPGDPRPARFKARLVISITMTPAFWVSAVLVSLPALCGITVSENTVHAEVRFQVKDDHRELKGVADITDSCSLYSCDITDEYVRAVKKALINAEAQAIALGIPRSSLL
jgi:hypothetical protein